MDYSQLIEALDKATSFDLFRLKSAIGLLLDDPQRIEAIKRSLRVGDEIDYFDSDTNRLIAVRVDGLNRKNASVREVESGKPWSMPYYMLNVQNVDIRIHRSHGGSPGETHSRTGLDRTEVAVGDTVGFVSREGHDVYGTVIRLNQKTVTLDCEGKKWRVAYSYLCPVIDGGLQQNAGSTVSGRVVPRNIEQDPLRSDAEG